MNLLDDKYQPLYFQTLRELVRIPSRSSRHGGEEARVQAYVADRMRKVGAAVRCFEASDYPEFFTHPLCTGPQRQYSGRPTVIGEIGPPDAPALLVLAHSDTVPIFEPEKWTRDPYDPGTQSDIIYGLGVGDDKWGVAALLILIQSLIESKVPLAKRLIFASTIDEEHGVSNGVLLLMLAGVQAEAALYLDGGDGQILLGNLGGSTFYLQPDADLSNEELAADAQALEQACRLKSVQREPLFERPYLRDNLMRATSVSLQRLVDENGIRLAVAFYTVEGEAPQAVQAELETLMAQTLGANLSRYHITLRQPWFEPAFTDPSTAFVQYMSDSYRAVMKREPHLSRNTKQDAFVLINHARIPTVSFGAGRTQMPGAYHSPDEFIETELTWKIVQTAHAAVSRWLATERTTP